MLYDVKKQTHLYKNNKTIGFKITVGFLMCEQFNIPHSSWTC